MIEQNAITREDTITFSVIGSRPVHIELASAAGATWPKPRGFAPRRTTDRCNNHVVVWEIGRSFQERFGSSRVSLFRLR
jgi:hypothetical protein